MEEVASTKAIHKTLFVPKAAAGSQEEAPKVGEDMFLEGAGVVKGSLEFQAIASVTSGIDWGGIHKATSG